MSYEDKFEGENTRLGFRWGPLEVQRWMSDKKYGVCIALITGRGKERVVRQVWISPKGRSVRISSPTKEKIKPSI